MCFVMRGVLYHCDAVQAVGKVPDAAMSSAISKQQPTSDD
jgi:cysteine sulfinate desulfinase/cysteine desulfurase-like protein